MQLGPLYTVTFTTPEAWSVEVAADTGPEGPRPTSAPVRAALGRRLDMKFRGELFFYAVR